MQLMDKGSKLNIDNQFIKYKKQKISNYTEQHKADIYNIGPINPTETFPYFSPKTKHII